MHGFREELSGINYLFDVLGFHFSILVAESAELMASVGHERLPHRAEPFEAVVMRGWGRIGVDEVIHGKR